MLALTWAATRVAGRLFGSGPEVAILVPAVMCVLAVAFSRFQDHIGRLQIAVPALLLLVVYVLVTEANSRIEGSAAAQQAPRVVLTVVVVCVVFALNGLATVLQKLGAWDAAIAAGSRAAALIKDRIDPEPVYAGRMVIAPKTSSP